MEHNQEIIGKAIGDAQDLLVVQMRQNLLEYLLYDRER